MSFQSFPLESIFKWTTFLAIKEKQKPTKKRTPKKISVFGERATKTSVKRLTCKRQ